ncbi:MAG: c-type cytochrome [Steroidobacter sp.]
MRGRFQTVLLCASLCALAACVEDHGYRPQAPRGDPDRGKTALNEHECNVCHVIPGVSGAPGYVGPPLTAYSRNVYVAGKFPNTPDILVQWIRDAPSLAPGTAMPAFEMTEAQAHDIAAYLYSLR